MLALLFVNHNPKKKTCPLLHDMLRSDILLAENNGNCWSRDLLETVRMLLPGTTSDSILSDLRHLKKLDWYTLETAFLKMHNDRWAELAGQVDPRSPVIEGGLSRKLVTYDKWFAAPLDDTGKPQIPQYLRNQNIPTDVVRSVARFRTSSHYLKVETDRWGSPPRPWADRICTLCDLSSVQDEMHV